MAQLEDKPLVEEANRLLSQGSFAEARKILDSILSAHPEHRDAHRLMARVYLDGGAELRSIESALEHIEKTYRIGGRDDPEVIGVLARALGASGRAEDGLRHLEQLYHAAPDMEAKHACAQRIVAFRSQFKMPDTWQFVDGFGTVVFESSDIRQIREAIGIKTIPRDAMCRRNRIGPFLPIQDSFEKEHPSPPELFKNPKTDRLLDVLTGALSGMLIGALLALAAKAVHPFKIVVIIGIIGGIVGSVAGSFRMFPSTHSE